MEVSENVDPSKGLPIGREAWTSRPGRVVLRCFEKRAVTGEKSEVTKTSEESRLEQDPRIPFAQESLVYSPGLSAS